MKASVPHFLALNTGRKYSGITSVRQEVLLKQTFHNPRDIFELLLPVDSADYKRELQFYLSRKQRSSEDLLCRSEHLEALCNCCEVMHTWCSAWLLRTASPA